jgi:GNAT superfamily N-acetyltransferase
VSSYILRKASLDDLDAILDIRHQASKRLKEDGVDQWQGSEPSKETFINDIMHQEAYVMIDQGKIISIASLCSAKEMAYEKLIDLSIDAITVHRIAVHQEYLRKGLTQTWFKFFEIVAKNNQRTRIYIDTHPDNQRMLSLLKKHDYTYMGEFEFKHLPSPLRRLFMKTILS